MVSGLRRWAEGSLTDQAAVELLASWSAGCHIRPGVAWVRPCRAAGFFFLDGVALAAHAATRAGDEQRVLLLAAALLNGQPLPRRRAKTGRAVA
jgi:acetoin utilization deacetylase AcuC-like enzyme